MVYSVYETVDSQKWNVFLVFQVNPNETSIKALIPYSDYQKYFTLKLPTLFKYNGKKLVKHDTFFWGKTDSPVEVEVDGERIEGLVRISGYQVIYKSEDSKETIDKIKKGATLKLNKHYWDKQNQKKYPTFSLTNFTKTYAKISGEEKRSVSDDLKIYSYKCKSNGSRKTAWINTSNGSYALNGHTIAWVDKNKSNGYPVLGNDGEPMKLGRDHFSSEKVSEWIQECLKNCR